MSLMDHGACCCVSFDGLYIHSSMARGNAHQTLEAIQAMVGIEGRGCIRMVVGPERVCIRIVQAITGIFVV